uniref:Putative secreted protein n=1 Tax=Ixodes ricinus TaxID=34613 RepID=A0A6B0U8N0_IXORI
MSLLLLNVAILVVGSRSSGKKHEQTRLSSRSLDSWRPALSWSRDGEQTTNKVGVRQIHHRHCDTTRSETGDGTTPPPGPLLRVQ